MWCIPGNHNYLIPSKITEEMNYKLLSEQNSNIFQH